MPKWAAKLDLSEHRSHMVSDTMWSLPAPSKSTLEGESASGQQDSWGRHLLSPFCVLSSTCYREDQRNRKPSSCPQQFDSGTWRHAAGLSIKPSQMGQHPPLRAVESQGRELRWGWAGRASWGQGFLERSHRAHIAVQVTEKSQWINMSNTDTKLQSLVCNAEVQESRQQKQLFCCCWCCC